MVDGFVKIFDEFRNGCDEKSVTITPQIVRRDTEKEWQDSVLFRALRVMLSFSS